jgi:hypothetical protein
VVGEIPTSWLPTNCPDARILLPQRSFRPAIEIFERLNTGSVSLNGQETPQLYLSGIRVELSRLFLASHRVE